jgi:hypothetical protein
MSGYVLPLPQYAFMAWCSVKKKAQGQLYLYLLSEPYNFNHGHKEVVLFWSLETPCVVFLTIGMLAGGLRNGFHCSSKWAGWTVCVEF